ncbi:LysR family transcriptional regulator [Photobacterium sanguinicancri]|uniref:LysR family transcriptional regulator n=1 Tax=Photobacterium sanguinicancri TaxID=875932 RepID=A0AAW7Y259_9GAMM|nr:LysR family transcriptional regulator [Photobacterium sanguinicancri]KXI21139.1 LysR family transcriptional regulator [Photobacterium sanguinicancri]MDO6541393.1 LysR family transcriptional regulator [Photobacterium sanguinicancri]
MDLNSAAMFAQVVECGSFTQAAEALDMTKSTVSRKVADLEKHLGVRLITRSTRQLTLTQEGERFYQSCIQMLEIMSQAELEVTASQDLIRGRLNIAMPVELGQKVMGKYINAFLKEYPNVTIHLELTNRDVDLIAEGIDLYAQVGAVSDSSMVARPFHLSHRIIVASPEYLAQHDTIEHPSDLVSPHHQVKVSNVVKLPYWELTQDEQQEIVNLPYRLRVNTITSALLAVVDGLGVAMLPEFICRPHLEEGRLVQILPDWQLPAVPVSFVYPQRQLIPKRLRVFIDFMIDNFKQR